MTNLHSEKDPGLSPIQPANERGNSDKVYLPLLQPWETRSSGLNGLVFIPDSCILRLLITHPVIPSLYLYPITHTI